MYSQTEQEVGKDLAMQSMQLGEVHHNVFRPLGDRHHVEVLLRIYLGMGEVLGVLGRLEEEMVVVGSVLAVAVERSSNSFGHATERLHEAVTEAVTLPMVKWSNL